MSVHAPPWRSSLRVIACLMVPLVAAGCIGPPGDGPDPRATLVTAPPGPRSTGLAAPGSPASPGRSTGTPRPGTTRPPQVLTVRAVPDRVDPLACTPPSPAERPEVTVLVESPDVPPGSLVVELQYSGSPGYEGEVQMRYDAGRNLFSYTLPPVTRAAIGTTARSIMLAVTARAPAGAGDLAIPPVSGSILIASACLNPTD
jgi:hypothetical protein